MQTIELLITDARGVYIPKDFTEMKIEEFDGIEEEDIETLRQGPDHEHYWDTWQSILDNAELDRDGKTWRLYQDGDLFLVRDDHIWEYDDIYTVKEKLVDRYEDENAGQFECYTDEEATERAREYIEETLWAFKVSFLASHSEVADEEVFQAIQANGRCEENNEAIKRLISDFDHFVDDAIACDGRGHFMNTYDGGEHEEYVNDQYFYLYRIN